MAAPIYNEIVEFEDGTPATQSQVQAVVVVVVYMVHAEPFSYL